MTNKILDAAKMRLIDALIYEANKNERGPIDTVTAGGVKTKEDIVAALCWARSEIKSFGVKGLQLYGSFAKGQQHSESDVDLLVTFGHGCFNFNRFIELSVFLDGLLKTRCELVPIQIVAPGFLGFKPDLIGPVVNIDLNEEQ